MAEEVKIPHVVDDLRTDQNFRQVEGNLRHIQGNYEALEAALDEYLKGDGLTPLVTPYLSLTEQASAPAALAGYGRLYTKSSDSQLYFKDDAGNEYAITPTGKSGIFECTADTSNSSTTAVNVTGMSFPVLANKDYGIRITIHQTSGATACAVVINFTGPASPTKFVWSLSWRDYVAAGDVRYVDDYISGFGTKSGNDHFGGADIAHVSAILQNGANSGTVQMQVSTEAAGTSVTVYAGSWGSWWLLN